MDQGMNIDLLGAIVGAAITLMIFSYLATDKLLFRWGLALLVGGGVGYALGLVVHVVLVDWITQLDPNQSLSEQVFLIIPLLLGLLLLLKVFAASKRLGWLAVLGNISMGYLVGVGTAVAISGAILGTLIPQVNASGSSVSIDGGLEGLISGIVIVIGTVTSLLALSPLRRGNGERSNPIMVGLQRVGRLFIVLALGVAFSGALTSALTALVVRLWHFAELLLSFLPEG